MPAVSDPGLFPLSLSRTETSERYEYSRFWTAYSVVLVICSFSAFPVTLNIYVHFPGISSLFYESSKVLMCLFITIFIALQIICLINGKRLIIIFKNISVFDCVLNRNVKKSKLLLIHKLQTITLLVVIISSGYEATINMMDVFRCQLFRAILCYGAMSFGCIVLWTVDEHFAFLVIAVLERYLTINEELDFENASCSKYHEECHSSRDGTEIKSQRILVIPPLRLDICSNSLDLSRLAILRKLHCLLSDISDLINTTYSFQNLLSLTIFFFHVTWSAYAFSVTIFIHNTGGSYNAFKPTSKYLPLWMLMFASKTITVLLACSCASKEANRTAVLVHKLLNRTKDPVMREELQLFSLQLLHRKVQFTACGFFPLDFTLLYSIVGAVTTYLIILIQFQLSYETKIFDNTTSTTVNSTTNILEVGPVNLTNVSST